MNNTRNVPGAITLQTLHATMQRGCKRMLFREQTQSLNKPPGGGSATVKIVQNVFDILTTARVREHDNRVATEALR